MNDRLYAVFFLAMAVVFARLVYRARQTGQVRPPQSWHDVYEDEQPVLFKFTLYLYGFLTLLCGLLGLALLLVGQ